MIGIGFRTIVLEFEEYWEFEPSPMSMRVLAEASDGLARYGTLCKVKLEKAAKARQVRAHNREMAPSERLFILSGYLS